AASTLRSGALSASRRLRRFGARRWQTDLPAAAEGGAIGGPAGALCRGGGAVRSEALADGSPGGGGGGRDRRPGGGSWLGRRDTRCRGPRAGHGHARVAAAAADNSLGDRNRPRSASCQ